MDADEVLAPLAHTVAGQILLGLRESLTVAGQLGRPVVAVNEALMHLRDACDGCITLTRPYTGEPQVVVTVVVLRPLKIERARRSVRQRQCTDVELRWDWRGCQS
jgi:hypothetical protein